MNPMKVLNSSTPSIGKQTKSETDRSAPKVGQALRLRLPHQHEQEITALHYAAASANQVEDQNRQSQHEQQMDQASGNMKAKTQQPQN
jgi:hypothetical protein